MNGVVLLFTVCTLSHLCQEHRIDMPDVDVQWCEQEADHIIERWLKEHL
jgi:hypothetical protein